MPAKKPAPKTAKGKKAAPAKAAAKKTAAVKRPSARKATRAPGHKPGPGRAANLHPGAGAVEEARKSAVRQAADTVKAPPQAPPQHSRVPSTMDTDEVEALEPGSLLAGPRNVQPYIPRRGEQYMSQEQLEHFRNILNEWKRDLMVEVDRTVSHMKDEAANFPDPSDRATQEEEFSLELRTRDRERKLIRKIDEALKRIEDGTYGYCLETGEEIGIKRLEARPVATLSIEAQERRERREKQYGDRDDRYR
ncbi:MAG: RNA polymerase-binding protein DksA [Steroidobacteraceae bacterium]|jgi:DnaK suppressor protein